MQKKQRTLLCVRATSHCPELKNQLNAAAAGWRVFHTADLIEARLLAQRHEPTVGLMVLGDTLPEPLAETLGKFLVDARQTEWVGVVQPGEVNDPQLREFIVQYFHDFHSLPIDVDRLYKSIGHAHGMSGIRRSCASTTPPAINDYRMIGSSRAMRDVFSQIDKVAGVDASVMIRGASGTGKELAARAIHERSPRANKPFVAVNCGAIPATLIQSVLFGHEKGAFTGAHARHIGRIEAADGGTVFLDEIGDLPSELQVTLLRFLQERTIERVGGTDAVAVDVRVITATHKDLRQLVRDKTFREDLYYRLHVLGLEMPALRDRREDIQAIAEYYLKEIASECDRRVDGFSARALKSMLAYEWPGNVRELMNKVHCAVVMSDQRLISADDLGLQGVRNRMQDEVIPLAQARREAEQRAMCAALEQTGNNVSEAARKLGISRVSFYRIMEKLKLPV